MLQWSRGNRLTAFGNNTYVYNSDGIRIKKTVGNVVHDYFVEGEKIIGEKIGNQEISYLYDLTGITGIKTGPSESQLYFFQKNVLGDIVAIVDYTGTVVTRYYYDAWGNHRVSITSGIDNDNHIGYLNPFRYRGYYYDVETGLYYLNARYYDPTTGRFISPDSIEYLDPETINGLNLFSYCGNNPVMLVDPSGHLAISTIIIGVLIGLVTTGIKDYINDGKLFNGDISGWEYFGAALGGAIGGLGAGLGTTFLASGVGNVIEAAFAGDISSFGDVMTQFALGGILGGVGYGISKGITSIFADKKILGILGNLNDNTKVNKRLAEAGFGHLKIGKHGFNTVYEELYKDLGYNIIEKSINSSYDFVVGLSF